MQIRDTTDVKEKDACLFMVSNIQLKIKLSNKYGKTCIEDSLKSRYQALYTAINQHKLW